jgi:ATP-dependent protease ClpP protease subunit
MWKNLKFQKRNCLSMDKEKPKEKQKKVILPISLKQIPIVSRNKDNKLIIHRMDLANMPEKPTIDGKEKKPEPANCLYCGVVIVGSSTCKGCGQIKINGKKYNRIKYGKEKGWEPEELVHLGHCHDCGIAKNGIHHFGCDVERCPRCAGQLISCDCHKQTILKDEWPFSFKISDHSKKALLDKKDLQIVYALQNPEAEFMQKQEIFARINLFLTSDLDLTKRVIYMAEEVVNWKLTSQICKAIYALDSMSPSGKEPIKIIMNNVGGNVYLGMAIYDMIKACRNPVCIYVFGQSMSMGALILQAANERVLSKNSRVMIHVGTLGLSENHPEINRRWMEQYDKDAKFYNKILIDRILEKHKDQSLEKIKSYLLKQCETKDKCAEISRIQSINSIELAIDELIKFDAIFNAEEAIDLGLADRILENMQEIA